MNSRRESKIMNSLYVLYVYPTSAPLFANLVLSFSISPRFFPGGGGGSEDILKQIPDIIHLEVLLYASVGVISLSVYPSVDHLYISLSVGNFICLYDVGVL